MLLLNLLTDIVQPKLIIYLLKEKVAAVVATLFSLFNQRRRRVLHKNLLIGLLFRSSQICNVLFSLSNRISLPKTRLQLGQRPKAFNVLGGHFTVLFAVGLLNIIDGVFAPRQLSKCHNIPIMRY